jgi:hypothetical protein
MSAAIEIPEDAYIVGVWHFELPDRLSKFGKGGNYLAILFRPEEQEPTTWQVNYRFRHYRDQKVWKSDDEFHSWKVIIRGEEEKVLASTDMAVQTSAAIAGEMVDFTEVRGSVALCNERLLNLPWFHSGVEENA